MRDKGVSSFAIFKWNLFVKSVASCCSDDACYDACNGAHPNAGWVLKPPVSSRQRAM